MLRRTLRPVPSFEESPMRRAGLVIALPIVAAAGGASAQHTGSSPHVHGEADPAEHAAPPMGALDLPMARLGSGTAWLPDAAPVRGVHRAAGPWHLMLHGNAFVGYDLQQGGELDRALVSQNWIMAMAGRPWLGGHVLLRTMFSLEPWTVGDEGYPLLLQTGETAGGEPLVDRQHPHDLFMEVAVLAEREVGPGVAMQGYAALAGEPALGPVAYPHRPSAMADPFAPLAHHWQDSTHIAFGVLTAGVFTRTVKVEASWFNGREPDENRTDLDLRALDSWSARVALNPAPAWSLQASYAYLASPEVLEPEVSVQRLTASAIHAAPRGRATWTSALVWGHNVPSEGPATGSLVAETALAHPRLGTTFARVELVEKTGHDFDLEMLEDEILPVGSLALGHVHPLPALGPLEPGLGLRGAVGLVDADLAAARYGRRTVWGGMLYLQLQPARL
jgi:hypothetical protein